LPGCFLVTGDWKARLGYAQKTGFFVRQMEASLALAEIEAKSRRKKDPQDLLQSVERNARGKGFSAGCPQPPMIAVRGAHHYEIP
jgi:hypothetical protein